MNMTENVPDTLRTVCVRTNTGGFGGVNTKQEELEMQIDECSKKLEDLQKCQKNRGLRWDRLARVNESLSLLEEEEDVHPAALAWLRTIREKTRVFQKLEHDFCASH